MLVNFLYFFYGCFYALEIKLRFLAARIVVKLIYVVNDAVVVFKTMGRDESRMECG